MNQMVWQLCNSVAHMNNAIKDFYYSKKNVQLKCMQIYSDNQFIKPSQGFSIDEGIFCRPTFDIDQNHFQLYKRQENINYVFCLLTYILQPGSVNKSYTT